jgi:hypothetical protein
MKREDGRKRTKERERARYGNATTSERARKKDRDGERAAKRNKKSEREKEE